MRMQSQVPTFLPEFSSVQSLSHVWLFATPWTAARQASLSTTNSQSLLILMSIESMRPSHPLSSPSPPTFNLSWHQGVFQWVNSLHEVVRVLEFQLQHQSFQWIFRTIPMNIPMNIQDNEYSMTLLPEGGSISVTKNWQVGYLPGALRHPWRCHFVTREVLSVTIFCFLVWVILL